MNTISAKEFKHTLKDIHKHTESRKFCFVLGAGASRSSGIATGGELARKWYAEIKERVTVKEVKLWLKTHKINEDELAASYGAIYRKRFENDKTSGYDFLIQAMKKAKPSFGHVVLAQILSRTSGHCVLTTNFDSLVESAVYQFTDKTPLVCGHESLSGYARPSNIHPLVIKIHRDLLLSPKSDPDEINELDPSWKAPLDTIFSTYIPIVIGYGGNDGSLMRYFETMAKPSNFFWCGLNGNDLSEQIRALITQMDGRFVEIKGFDELMHELLWVFDEIGPIEEELETITKHRIEMANRQLEALSGGIDKKEESSREKQKELSALEYYNLAEKESDLEKRKIIYLNALKQYPKTAWLWHGFTHFLQVVKKDFENLEKYYLEALKLDSDHAGINGNYAIYLDDIKKDYDKAEKHYLKALSLNPDNAIINGNYAVYLKNIKKDYNNAEKHYLKALKLDPNRAIHNGNYANYLNYVKKDYDKAEKYYLKALSLDPDHAVHNGNYAVYLNHIKKDYDEAEKYYRKTLSLNPDSSHFNGNYAQLLLINKRKEEATQYINKAFEFNGGEKTDLSIELWFYRYAHYPEFLSEAEKHIETLLAEGIRSIGWDFGKNIEVALEENHPNPAKLNELASRITSAE